jgi:hypothetical protein
MTLHISISATGARAFFLHGTEAASGNDAIIPLNAERMVVNLPDFTHPKRA